MADIKITALTALSGVTGDDLFIVVDNPSGSASTKKVAASGLATSLQTLMTASGIGGFNNSVSGILPVKNIVAGSGAIVSSSSGTYTISISGIGGLGTLSLQNANSVNITGGSISGITDLSIADGGTGASSASGARANLGIGTIATQNASGVAITGGSISGITDLAVADGGTGSSTASGARYNLGLGSLSIQNSGSVNITGGSITGITDLAVADGGTGASNASSARLNLGLGDMATQEASGVNITGGTITGTTFTGSISATGVTITGGTITGITDLAIADGGTGASTAATARSNLGLGTIATQNSNDISITGGSISGIVDLAISDGGTGASTAAAARTNLGLGTISTQNSNNITVTGGTLDNITYLGIESSSGAIYTPNVIGYLGMTIDAQGGAMNIVNNDNIVLSSAGGISGTYASYDGYKYVINNGIKDQFSLYDDSIVLNDNTLCSGNLSISTQTANRILSLDSNKNITSLNTSSYPSLVELAYLKSTTGTIQTQLNNKAAYDISILSLGSLSGTNSINCGQDRQIQTLTLRGSATTLTKGSGWPTSNTVSRETTLNIYSSGTTSVTWSIVNDWYRQPDSPLPSGYHIVLLRAIGSGTIEGHYIGNKTN